MPPSGGTSPSRTCRIAIVAIAGTSERAELAGEVGDQRVEHADHDSLAHRRGLAGDLRVRVDRAAAVGEREGDVGVRESLPAGLLRLDAASPRCVPPASCSTISTVPVNVIDIAPIFTLISALTVLGSTISRMLPPSTHGTTRSRSRIGGVALVDRLRGDERMVELDGHVRGSLIGSAHGRSHTLGPENGSLAVKTDAHRRRGQGGTRSPASTSPPGRRRSTVGEETTIVLDVDCHLARACARAPAGCRRSATTTRRASSETIDEEVLKRQPIAFRSTAVQVEDGRIGVAGRADARRRHASDRVRARPSPAAGSAAASSSSRATGGSRPSRRSSGR